MNRIAGLRDRVGIAYGGDYNPEQWPEEVWDEDVRLMREAGVSLVSVGIFSWASVEPRPGEYDFGWLDRVLDRLAEGGVAACLATMTASPPPWLTTLHPEMLTVRADGSTISPGGRQHYCPSSPVYREHAVRLAEQVATRYAGHPALAVWHVNNEYGNVIPCHCDVSAAAFRRWLADRYGSVDELNDAWSTRFWAQGYGSFDEVLPPRSPAPFTNPAQELDYARFTSDELLACYLAEKEVLDRITPDVPVTTNFPPSLRPVDQWTWAPHLDVIAYDAYPDPLDPDATAKIALSYDVMRSLRDGQPWLLMEQAPGAVNWRPRNAPKPRGAMRLWSWQAVAHGADAVMFFQWRQARGGAERFHSAMVPHGGPATRIFGEVRDLGRELAAARALAGARAPRADAAMVLDWPSWWALEGPAHPSADVRFLDAAWACHRPLYDAGVACDVVRPDADLSGYRLVVVPNLYLTSEAAARTLERYVEEGGTLVMAFFSGIVDLCDRVHLGGYPAPFRRMLGLTVEEFHPLAEDASVGLPGGSGTLWSEELRLEGAEAVERFTTGALAGEPAVTRHRFGRGDAWYLATRPDPATMRRLFDRVREEAGVAPVLPGLPDGVQARARDTEDGRWYVVLNHGTEPADVPLPTAMRDVLTGAEPTAAVRLDSRGVAVLRPA
ncbi:beta-galactosidase [Actinoallomurus soli]|uniref:beta-galactosidase n=1 Tax=Actinoallomurus soli TaxID=2952535 RepID=UPI0020937BF7|nr:beta-galactosidase [Actinoallomurus soli]MCO5967448.1 beta-galactosidase [Actinoallomurus soli]